MKQYIMPLCEEITINATSELLTGSPSPTPQAKHLPVAYIDDNVVAD